MSIPGIQIDRRNETEQNSIGRAGHATKMVLLLGLEMGSHELLTLPRIRERILFPFEFEAIINVHGRFTCPREHTSYICMMKS